MAFAKKAAATAADVTDDLQALRDDLARLTRQMAQLLSSSGEEAIGEAKTRMRRLRDDLGERVAAAGDRGREALSDVSGHVGEALEGSLREHPLAGAGLALALGFLVGAMLRR
jgi:ElaB/YqjD/DUF883 family membrane-anchored ribosome-binding protein